MNISPLTIEEDQYQRGGPGPASADLEGEHFVHHLQPCIFIAALLTLLCGTSEFGL
ncbi:MAG: hypothetical protein Q8M07_11160 [Prosthecobacter sp.]|nr:hypothetical protein [Prosthecobacter sp.]